MGDRFGVCGGLEDDKIVNMFGGFSSFEISGFILWVVLVRFVSSSTTRLSLWFSSFWVGFTVFDLIVCYFLFLRSFCSSEDNDVFCVMMRDFIWWLISFGFLDWFLWLEDHDCGVWYSFDFRVVWECVIWFFELFLTCS